LLSRPVPQWVLQAERESFTYMTPRCGILAAPSETSDRAGVKFSLDYDSCMAREGRAIELAWKPYLEKALEQCKQTGVACCSTQVSDNASTNRFWLNECNLKCAGARGKTPEPHQLCSPRIIDQPPLLDVPNRTPAVKDVTQRCEGNHIERRGCVDLPTRAERLMCEADCDRSYESKYYHERVRTCVDEAIATGVRPKCKLEHSMEATGLTEAGCLLECEKTVAAKATATSAPRSD
jgi:hypothetical protein